MCFKNLPIEFDAEGKARLIAGVADPYKYESVSLEERDRKLKEIARKNGQVRAAAEREAVNMPIQGTAADVLKKAMIAVHAELERFNAGRSKPSRMILTVHDELLFEVPESDAAEAADLVRGLMEHAFPLNVPLTADVGVGRNWKEAKP